MKKQPQTLGAKHYINSPSFARPVCSHFGVVSGLVQAIRSRNKPKSCRADFRPQPRCQFLQVQLADARPRKIGTTASELTDGSWTMAPVKVVVVE
jgi:hypothetical protein